MCDKCEYGLAVGNTFEVQSETPYGGIVTDLACNECGEIVYYEYVEWL